MPVARKVEQIVVGCHNRAHIVNIRVDGGVEARKSNVDGVVDKLLGVFAHLNHAASLKQVVLINAHHFVIVESVNGLGEPIVVHVGFAKEEFRADGVVVEACHILQMLHSLLFVDIGFSVANAETVS